jgi:carboxylate-amine ligase
MEIMEELQMAGRRLITQALHVHIGMPDKATAIKVCDAIRPYLPVLLALSTSSPFLEEENTGYYSYRTSLFQNLPRTGIPGTLSTWEHFQELILILNQSTLLKGIKELWWDVRPHPEFGTLEIRICDLPSRFDEIISLVALVQALAAMLTEQAPSFFPSQDIMMHNKWHAARYGLNGTYINSSPGSHFTFSKTAKDLLDTIQPFAEKLNSKTFLGPLSRILETGTSAAQQKTLHTKHQDLRKVVQLMQENFWK